MAKKNLIVTILLSIVLVIVIIALLVNMAIIYFSGKYNEEAEKKRLPLESPDNYAGYEYISEVYQNNKDSIKIYAIDGSDKGYEYKIGFVKEATDKEKAQIILDFHDALQNNIENNDTDLSIRFYNSFANQSQPYDILLSTGNNSKEKYISLFVDSNILPLESLSNFDSVGYLRINYYFISDDIERFARIISNTAIKKLVISRIDSYVDETKLAETKHEIQTTIQRVSSGIEVEIL